MLYNMVFIKVLVYLSSATCTMNLQNPKNGSKLPSLDFANPPNRYLPFYKSRYMYYFLESKLNFGKHKEKSIKEILTIEPSYINWCARNVTNFIITNDEVVNIRNDFPNFYFSYEENRRIYYWIFSDLDNNEEIYDEEIENCDYDFDPNWSESDYSYTDYDRNDDFKTDWTNYNDDLDWDQQSQEFWEQF